MKPAIAITFALHFLLLQPVCAQTEQSSFVATSRTEKELVRLTKTICAASQTGDSATIARYLAPGFLLTFSSCKENSNGKFFTKANVVSKWGQKPAVGTENTSTPTIKKIQVTGATAIVHSLIVDVIKEKSGQQTVSKSWVTDVWVKRKSRWLWFSSHESFLYN